MWSCRDVQKIGIPTVALEGWVLQNSLNSTLVQKGTDLRI